MFKFAVPSLIAVRETFRLLSFFLAYACKEKIISNTINIFHCSDGFFVFLLLTNEFNREYFVIFIDLSKPSVLEN